jgi:uncharacterized damage-inducible protein DinB
MTEIERIVDELQREHSGEPWHGSPLRQILKGVNAAHAAAQPIAGGHSIWELVLHITAWKNEVRRRLSGAAASDPDEGDWPPVGETSDARWRQALAALERAHTELVAAIRQVPEAQLSKATNDPRAPGGTGVSYYVLLHGIVQHDAYHSGQIAMLKKGLSGAGV